MVKFKEIESNYDHIMAITEEEQLYGRGYNIQHRMGLKKENDKFKPTHKTYLKNYTVGKVVCGVSNPLLIAFPKKKLSILIMYH